MNNNKSAHKEEEEEEELENLPCMKSRHKNANVFLQPDIITGVLLFSLYNRNSTLYNNNFY